MPFFATGTHYSPDGNWLEGLETSSYHATYGWSFGWKEITHIADNAAFYLVALAILTTVYLVCSIRTNFCLFSALFLLVITFGLFAGTYFNLAEGQAELAAKLQVVGSMPGFLVASTAG
jgi:succinate-acetate transporter protein